MSNIAQSLHSAEESVGTWNESGRVQAIMQRWSKYTTGIQNAEKRRLLSILGENQLSHMKRIQQEMNEDTTSSNVGSFTKYIFPVLRRVVINQIAPFLVSVQPMMAPVGGIFVREAKFGTTKGAITAGANVFQTFDEEYSSERITGELVATADGTNYGATGVALSFQLGFFPVRKLSVADGFSVVVAEYNGSTAAQTATDNGSGGFTGDVSAGTINYQTGAVSGMRFTTIPTATRPIKATYQFNMELNSRIPDMNLEVTLTPIVARPRKMKGTWSPEANEDFRQMNGIDAESDLTVTMAQEMGLEIDREVVNDVAAFATSSGSAATYDAATASTDVGQVDGFRRILTAMGSVSSNIWKKTRRAEANWAVLGTDILNIVSQLATHGDYQPALNAGNLLGGDPNASILNPASYTNTTSNYGIRQVGMMRSKWSVYVDPLFTSTKVLMGLKGDSYLDAGYVFSPYVMFMLTPTFYNPTDFSFRKGVRSRYAKSRIRGDWYGMVTCSNLPVVT